MIYCMAAFFVDSRDMNFLQMFINDIDAATPPFAAAGAAIRVFTHQSGGDLILNSRRCAAPILAIAVHH